MKVGFVAESFPTADEMSGGVRVSVRRQADFLSREHEVVVLAARMVFPPFSRYSEMKAAQGRGERFRSVEQSVRVYRPPCVHFPLLWKAAEPFQLALWTVFIFSVLERGTSLIHAHRCFPAGYAAALAVSVLGLPLVLTVYGSDVNLGLDRAVVGAWVSSATRFALRRASHVIAVSQALVERMRAFGLEGVKTRVIPSGADQLLPDSMGQKEAREALGLPAGGKIVLMASNLVPVKDPVTMLRAFAVLRGSEVDATLVILGKGELEPVLQREIAALDISDAVLLKGRRPRDEVPLWLRASDVVALSSLDEGCPVIALEAFASGRPFVGTAVGGVPEIVPDGGVGILVEPSDPEALAAALKEALGKSWNREHIVRHGLRFSWETVTRRISAVYAGM
ncbi:MAG: glycosyltransferase [Candidatus Eiseniibacteriota bacterium]|nr:MAG: glycosyltransferase [Candidatus Eisenbacteria bacterium]